MTGNLWSIVCNLIKKTWCLGFLLGPKKLLWTGKYCWVQATCSVEEKILLMHLLSLDYFCHHQGLFTSDLTNIFYPMQLLMWQGEINLCWHNIFLRLLWSFCDKIHLKTWMASKWEFFGWWNNCLVWIVFYWVVVPTRNNCKRVVTSIGRFKIVAYTVNCHLHS